MNRVCASKRGFSLLELLITLIVASVLITLAVPSYEHIIINTRRLDAKIGLLQLAAQLETNSNNLAIIQYSPENYYQLKILVNKSDYYLLAAYPLKSQTKDKRCNILAYDSLGQKGVLKGNKIIMDKYCWE